MHFDDRLATVLRLPQSGEGLARIQFRQLIDILGRAPSDTEPSETLEAGYERLASLAKLFTPADKERLLRQPLQMLTNSRLIGWLAQAEPDIATAAIPFAHLTTAEWLNLLPTLPAQMLEALRQRTDLPSDVSAALSNKHQSPSEQAELPVSNHLGEWTKARMAAQREEISAPKSGVTHAMHPAATTHEPLYDTAALARRIEEFRNIRSAAGKNPSPIVAEEQPREALTPNNPLPLAEQIDFTTNVQGKITWATAPYAPSLFGLSISSAQDSEHNGPDLIATVKQKRPIETALIRISGAPCVSGLWHVDAFPYFDDGRFTGYRGRFRRPSEQFAQQSQAVQAQAERMREILHELRTPANAIQVAAEIIQQQLYGPAPHEYRALAASIAGDCAHILAGFDEIDRLVKLETGTLTFEEGVSNLASVLFKTVTQLQEWASSRGITLRLPNDLAEFPLLHEIPVSIADKEIERTIWRIIAGLAGCAAKGDHLDVTYAYPTHLKGQRIKSGHAVKGKVNMVLVSISLPAKLASYDESSIFEVAVEEHAPAMPTGMFGIGFTLRLAAAEIHAAGGVFQKNGDTLELALPLSKK